MNYNINAHNLCSVSFQSSGLVKPKQRLGRNHYLIGISRKQFSNVKDLRKTTKYNF